MSVMNRRTIDAIESVVTIPMIMDYHGIKHGRRRCNCPIHHSTRRDTFSFNDNVYHCFSCGEGGGVIQLEQALSGTSADDACRSIARAFGVNIADGPMTRAERADCDLTRRLERDYEDYENEKHEYYIVLSEFYRYICKRRQHDKDPFLLSLEKSLEEWLDNNLEGVVIPWIFQNTQATTSLTERSHTN